MLIYYACNIDRIKKSSLVHMADYLEKINLEVFIPNV